MGVRMVDVGVWPELVRDVDVGVRMAVDVAMGVWVLVGVRMGMVGVNVWMGLGRGRDVVDGDLCGSYVIVHGVRGLALRGRTATANRGPRA
jgi:hypothetical protein